MLAGAGLLAGTMFKERSFEYWKEDMISLLLLLFSGRGLLKHSMQLARDSMIYAEKKRVMDTFLAKQHEVLDDDGRPVTSGNILPANRSQYTEAEVVEAVSTRIKEKKDKAVKDFTEGR